LPCFYLLMGPDEELDLARAELAALAGCVSSGRVAIGAAAADVSRSAYIRLSADQLAVGANWPELRRAITRLDLHCNRYRTEVFRPGPKMAVSTTGLQKSIADLISGYPDLGDPRVKFALIVTQSSWRFGTIISRSTQRWRRHSKRPHYYSHGLPPQIARALVNLVAAPGDSLLDPCCGSGTVVAEALSDGIRAWGVEVYPSLASQAAANLRSLSLPANVIVADARTIRGNFDAAVIDFPYGHSGPVDEGLYRDVLINLRDQVDRMALVFGCGQRPLLEELGLVVIQQASVAKGQLTRHIYVVSTKKEQQPVR